MIRVDDMDLLLPKPAASTDRWAWGTVTGVSPLRVRLDGDSTPLDLTPDTLATVSVSDRVWCQIAGRRVVVHGVAH